MYAGPAFARHAEYGDVVIVRVVYNGNPADGEKELAPLQRIGKPAADGVVVQDHMVMQTARAGVFHHGIRSHAKNGIIRQWSPRLVNAMIDAHDPRVLVGSHVAGGAVKRVGELDTAFPRRNAELTIVVASIWEDAALDEERIAAVRAVYLAPLPEPTVERRIVAYPKAATPRRAGRASDRPCT